MKVIKKSIEPEKLKEYRETYPSKTWVRASKKIRKLYRKTCMKQQGYICCYCECDLNQIGVDNFCRVEHFHQKSDTMSTGTNWHLDWNNIFAACNGITDKKKRYIYPHPNNLSCDSHKNHLVQANQLPIQCEGLLINPLQIPAFPNIFKIDFATGELMPDDVACSSVSIPDNRLTTTKDLVQSTINILNLNCDRLCRERKLVLNDIEGKIRAGREKRKSVDEVFTNLTHHFFQKKWPAYFTTIRCRLGKYAEDYLHSISFQG